MLNLLPKTRKQQLRRRYIAQQLRFLTGVAVIASSIAVVMLFVSDWLLQNWLEDITVTTTADIISVEERTELKSIVDDLVELSAQAQPLLATPTYPLHDLTNLLQPTPEDIQLHSLDVDYVEHSVQLNGTAANRAAIVTYQQTLSAIPGIRTVRIPLDDLTLKTDIPFTVQATYETPPLAKTE